MTDDPGWHGARLREAFAARGFDSETISLTRCRLNIHERQTPIEIPGFKICLPDGVFVRGVPGGSLDEVVFYLDILHALKACGIPVYNDGRAIERSVDKALTSFLLQHAGIPTPATWVMRDRDDAMALVRDELKHGHQVVSKPLFGSQGIGLQRLSKLSDLSGLVNNGIYYLQRFIGGSDASSYDWRVFVIDGQSVAVMRRVGSSWLNNVAQGARCEKASPDDAMVQMAEAAIKALDMNYGGVDIIRDEQGNYSVIEVNSIPAWKGLQSVCDENIANLLARDFLSRCDDNSSATSAVSCG